MLFPYLIEFAGIPILYLLLIFVLASIVVALLNRPDIFKTLDSFEVWVQNSLARVTNQRRWHHLVFLIQPTLWLWKQACDWTQNLRDPRLKYGLRLWILPLLTFPLWKVPTLIELLFSLAMSGIGFG